MQQMGALSHPMPALAVAEAGHAVLVRGRGVERGARQRVGRGAVDGDPRVPVPEVARPQQPRQRAVYRG